MTDTQSPLERVRTGWCGLLPGSPRQVMLAAAIRVKRSWRTPRSGDNG